MRLIDADEVKRFYEEEFPNLDNGVHWSRNDIICNLDNIPTAKAISTNWIKNWCLKHYPTYPRIVTEQLLKKTETWQMIEDWEKENETSSNG